MKFHLAGWVLCLCCVALATGDEPDVNDGRGVEQGLRIADLSPALAGQELTVRFTVAGLQGVAQRGQPGQSPTFIIETKPETDTANRLVVWIEGELSDVLHRLQLAFLQQHALKSGAMIEATGRLRVYTRDGHSFSMDVDRWQDFRILPGDADEVQIEPK